MADPGLHVADTCPITKVVLVQHVVKVTLALRLEQKGKAAKRYSDHCVTLYTNASTQHPLLVGTYSLGGGGSGTIEVTIPVCITPRPPTMLLVQWYASAYDPEDGLIARELVAGGVEQSQEVRLFDVENIVQGVLHVKGWPFSSSSSSSSKVNAGAQRLIQQVSDSYSTVRPAMGPGDRFSAVQIQIGNRVRPMPIAFYVAHSTRMRANPAAATAYFENAIRLVRTKDASPAQTLADVLALPSLGWIYRPDVTRTGADADQWSSIHSVPSPSSSNVPIAFDCEDGSKAMLELLHVMQTITFVNPSSGLLLLQSLARLYVGYLAICELKSDTGSARPAGVGGSNYLNHALVLMLPRSRPDVGATLYPITLESTAYCSGDWHATVMNGIARDESQFARDNAQMTRSLSSAADRFNARVKSPISLVVNQTMYRRLIALVTASATGTDPTQQRTQHHLLNVDMKEFMFRYGGWLGHKELRASGSIVTVIDLPTADLITMCEEEFALIPVCRFPVPTTAAAAAGVGDAAFVLPTANAKGNTVYVHDSMALTVFSRD